MQIFVFNCANQRLRRFTSGVIYADSYPYTVFRFNFNTPDWDISPTKIAVFSYNGENYNEPLDENNMCKVPKEVLYKGSFKVSIHNGQGLLTNTIRIAVESLSGSTTPEGGNGGNCDCGPNMVYVPEVDEKKILSWTLQEVTDDMPSIPPTDLNPNDEWLPTGNEVETDYIWEPMQ